MDCNLISKLTAWPCRLIEGSRGETGLVLIPPVTFWDGSVIPAYVFQRGDSFEITDDGTLVEHLDTSGFKVSRDKRRRKGLEESLAKWGVSFDGELQVLCKPEEMAYGLQRFAAALFSAATWESENAGKAIDANLLISEVEIYLRAIQPDAAISHDGKLKGLSGRVQAFPLRVGATYYDAVGTHPSASAAMVKRLLDVRLSRENQGLPITVVIEDRSDPARAKADTQIYSQLAHVTRLSELREEALKVLRPQ
jgi:hypothetical protein